eukprot:942292-Ditylum_brightwellii.AAC.1
MRQDWKWDKRIKLYVFASHRSNCTKLDVQLWHRNSTISRDWTGNGVKSPSSMCSLHTEQIAPNLICNDCTKPNNQQGLERRWMMKTQLNNQQ